jgi:hypothetical protein
MFAINHAATALIIKKEFIHVPIVWLLISVQFMEILWVILNFLGIERTTTEKEVRYVGDIHLSFMPFSHSILTMIGVALLAWLVLGKGLDLPGAGIAVGIGVLSHLILDLITHSKDMVIAPLMKSPKFGLGLYAKHPIVAFILEIGYGIVCWWIYKGSLGFAKHHRYIQFGKHFDVLFCGYRHRKTYGKPTEIDTHRHSCPNSGNARPCWNFQLT